MQYRTEKHSEKGLQWRASPLCRHTMSLHEVLSNSIGIYLTSFHRSSIKRNIPDDVVQNILFFVSSYRISSLNLSHLSLRMRNIHSEIWSNVQLSIVIDNPISIRLSSSPIVLLLDTDRGITWDRSPRKNDISHVKVMEHEHITFYANSARGKAALLGGEELILGWFPLVHHEILTLWDSTWLKNCDKGGLGEHEAPTRQRTANDKHVEIVQYLKQLSSNARVSRSAAISSTIFML